MRLAAVTIAAAFAWTACSGAGPVRPVVVEAGKEFRLRVGQSAGVADGELQVGFDGVVSDSRCAKGEQCIRAGDAVVRVWLQRRNGPRETRELRFPPDATPAARPPDAEIRLVRLEPVPVSGRPIAPGDYVATLALGRPAPAESER